MSKKKSNITVKAVENAAGKMGLDVKLPEEIEIEVPKKIKFNGLLGFILAVTLIIFGGSLYMYNSIPKTASSIGNTLGTATGWAVGSLQAALDAPEAVETGIEEGRSAQDTKATVDGFLQNCGQLQVMRADSKFVNLNNNANNYITLMKKTGDAVFTVNLLEAKFDPDKKVLTIPDIEIRLDMNDSTEILAEYDKGIFGGNAGDGIIGTLNSEVKTTQEAILELKHDSSLMGQIREKSKARIQQLIYSLLNEEIKVQGVWESGERR